jgi:hypothetical protein
MELQPCAGVDGGSSCRSAASSVTGRERIVWEAARCANGY